MISYIKEKSTDEELFNVLCDPVKKWFKKKFKSFCLPQQYALMNIHSRKNTLISSPTGSGKTLTAFLSIINELTDLAIKGKLEKKIYCVYCSPLKALNRDIRFNLMEPLKEIEEIYGKELGIKVTVRSGDTTASEKSKMLKDPPHILITTPESLAILLSSIKFKDHLKEVQWLVVDEVHSLAENKRGSHFSLTIERLQRLCGYMTRVGLSATISPLEEIAKYLVGYEEKEPRQCDIVDVQFIKELDLKVVSPVKNIINADYTTIHKALYKKLHEYIQDHSTTLIFTNTRSATERVIDTLRDLYPKHYSETNIGAHHGSLSKEYREGIEENLRLGKLKCVVSSTSLELGIDIGHIDLVLLLGSPKSVARALQRCGRAGHQIKSISKGRIIVLDRDDLVECALILKCAVEHKIDKIHIPKNALDVLAQHIIGIAVSEKILVKDLFELIQSSYSFHTVDYHDFMEVIYYLAGQYAPLEERHVYAKIWYDENEKMIGRRGRMTRVLYMTNIGTIPDQTGIIVKTGNNVIGTIDEAFMEKLKPGDIFVLAGSTYIFRYSKGQVAYVQATDGRPPTVPSWFSEMLPLSFDLAKEIGRFRRLMSQRFCTNETQNNIKTFIRKHLYVDENAVESIYEYFREQFDYRTIPSDKRIIIEHYNDERGKYVIFHSMFGRRVNDCLSRAVAFAVSRKYHLDVDMGINDNGFYLRTNGKVSIMTAFKMLKSDELRKVLENAIEKTEVFKRRFRHCAARALMILRNYKGRSKYVGRQQVDSMILMSAVRRISNEFVILKEARREVLEDLMDIDNAQIVLKEIEAGKIKTEEIHTDLPSPFAFNLVMQGFTDILRMEEKQEFLRRMHRMVIAKIYLEKNQKKSKKNKSKKEDKTDENFDYMKYFSDEEKTAKQDKEIAKEFLIEKFKEAAKKINLDANWTYEGIRLIEGERKGYKQEFLDWLDVLLQGDAPMIWDKDLIRELKEKRVNIL